MSQTISYGERMQGGAQAKKGAAGRSGVRVRNVALPVEHGGWGFTLEPVALGLILAPSLPGLFLSVATVAAFLARHPLKLVMADRRRGRRFPRTPVAERFAALYAVIALLGLLTAIKTASSYNFLLPLILAAPLASVQLVYDRLSRSRALLPELAGACAMASIAASLALAGGWPLTLAFALWVTLAARVVPSILYVRARLKRLHGKEASASPVLAAHLVGLALALAFAWTRLIPALAVVALLLLLARAALGFSKRSRATSAKQIGILELVFGAVTVAGFALGHYFNL